MSTSAVRAVVDDWPAEEGPPAGQGRSPLRLLAALASFLWLLPAVAMLLGTHGRWMFPAAAWLAPLFLLRFARSQSTWIALPVAFAVIVPVSASIWWAVVPFEGALRGVAVGLIGLAAFLPYLADRLLVARLRGWGSSLVFPLSVVVVEFLLGLTPFGTWCATGYTQAHDLPLMQVVSVTGISGLTFLIAWLAAVANTVWERGPRDPGARIAAIAFVVTMVLVHLLGGWSVRRGVGHDTVRIASFTMTTDPPLRIAPLLGSKLEGQALTSVRGQLQGLQASLFARATQEARAGAQVVFWSEANAIVLDSDVDGVLSEGAGVSHDEGVYLGMAFSSLTPGQGTYDNRFVLLDPAGEILIDYRKARPRPGAPERGADRHLATVETPIGRLACAIGSDADDPGLMREAGQARADIVLVPASDTPRSGPVPARLALARGIENGLSIVRQTRPGLSAATDARGRTIASVDYDETRTTVMVAQVPKHGVPTFYSRAGDLFAWLCLVALALFVGLAVRAGRPTSAPTPA